MLLTHASHPDPFEANGMPPTYGSMHQSRLSPSQGDHGVRVTTEMKLMSNVSCKACCEAVLVVLNPSASAKSTPWNENIPALRLMDPFFLNHFEELVVVAVINMNPDDYRADG